MSKVSLYQDESLDHMLKRFKKKVEDDGIIKEYRDRQYFMKPSLKKRLKEKESKRKQQIKQIKKNRNKSFDRK